MSMRRQRQNLRSSLVWVGAESFITILAAMCTTLVVARIIGPTEFGIAAVAYLVGSLAEVIVTTPFVDPLIQRRCLDNRLINAGFTAMFAAGLVLYLLILASAPLIARLYGHPALIGLLAAQGTTCVFLGLRGVPEALLARKLRFNLISIRGIIAKIAGAVVSLMAALAGMGAWSIILGNVAAAASSAIMIVFIVKRMPRLAYHPEQVRSLFSFGFFSLLDAVMWTAISRIFNFFIGYFYGVRVLGEFNIAFRINDTVCGLIGSATTRLAFPMLSRISSDRRRLEKDFLNGSRLVWVIVAPIFLGLAFTSSEIVDLTLGPEWRIASAALVAVCLFSLLAFSRLLAHPLVKAVGRPALLMGPNIAGLAYIFVGCLAFREAGFNALLGLWTSFGIIFVVCSINMVHRAIGMDWLTQMKPLMPATFPSLGMCLVLLVISATHPTMSMAILLLLKIGIGGITYLLLLAAFQRPLLLQILGRSAPACDPA
jgi:O-antigen/teichoic acid export membrane protein